jgi:hypothetical protein
LKPRPQTFSSQMLMKPMNNSQHSMSGNFPITLIRRLQVKKLPMLPSASIWPASSRR